MYYITWEAFNQATLLADGDIISLREEPGPDAAVEVELRLGPRVTWWKEIKAIGHNGTTMRRIARSGRYRGPLSFTVPVAELDRLVFSKAKFLGRHTQMYSVGPAHVKAGLKLSFSWDRD